MFSPLTSTTKTKERFVDRNFGNDFLRPKFVRAFVAFADSHDVWCVAQFFGVLGYDCVIAALTNNKSTFPGCLLESLLLFSTGCSLGCTYPIQPRGSTLYWHQASHSTHSLVVNCPLVKCGVQRFLQRGGLLRRPACTRLSLVALPRRHHRRRQLHRGRRRARRQQRRQRDALGGQLVPADAQQRRPLLDAKYESQI